MIFRIVNKIFVLFLLFGFIAYSDGKDNVKETTDRIIYSLSEGQNNYKLTIGKKQAAAVKSSGNLIADGDYSLEYNGNIVSSGTIEVNGAAVTFKTAKKKTFYGALQGPNIVFSTSNTGRSTNSVIRDDAGAELIVPPLAQADGWVFPEGYTKATDVTSAYLYYKLPKQFQYSRTIGASAVGEKGRWVFTAPDAAAVNKSKTVLFAGKTPQTFQAQGDAVEGYSIGQWVTQDKVNAHTPKPAGVLKGDARRLYSYAVYTAGDGFGWRTGGAGWGHNPPRKGYGADLSWDGEFGNAYISTLLNGACLYYRNLTAITNGILVESRNYRNTSFPEHVFALRTINVQLGTKLNADRSNLVRIQTGATPECGDAPTGLTYSLKHIAETPSVPVLGVKGIKILENFLTSYVTANAAVNGGAIETREFTIQGLNGGSVDYTWEQIRQAYFIPSQERIVMIQNGAVSKAVNYPVAIIIKGAAAFLPGEHADNPPPAPAAVYR